MPGKAGTLHCTTAIGLGNSGNSPFHSHIPISYELLEHSSELKETSNLAQGYIPLFFYRRQSKYSFSKAILQFFKVSECHNPSSKDIYIYFIFWASLAQII